MMDNKRSGQSLVEVVIGLAIGAVLMGTAAFAVTTMLRTNLTSEKSQFASRFAQSLSDNVRSFAVGNWDSLYGLTKATSSHYFLNASGTTFFVVQGEEGMLDGEVTNGLVGHWKFDEVETTSATSTYDATGSNKHGTLFNSPARASSTCRVGNCLEFDGTSGGGYALNNGGGFLPSGSSERTITFWFKPNSGMTTANIAFGYGCSTEGYGCGSAGVGRYVGAWAYTARIGLHLETCQITGPITPEPTTGWHLYTAIFNGDNTVTFYIDGGTPTTVTAGCTINSSSGGGFSIGVGRWGYYNGALDDVRVYDHALSADEVQRLWNSGVYERFFTIENVCRTNDASSTIASTAPCSGTLEDASTQWITSYTQWTAGAGTSEVTLPAIVARWQNAVFHQTDWSGGAADEGAVASPTSKFSSSSNASTTGGLIQIQNLTQE